MMKQFVIPTLFLVLGGCVAPAERSAISISSSSYTLAPRANTAPRGSAEFCRTYGQQTADNRLRSSTRTGGRGPSGFDTFRAAEEGERAIARCTAGRTN